MRFKSSFCTLDLHDGPITLKPLPLTLNAKHCNHFGYYYQFFSRVGWLSLPIFQSVLLKFRLNLSIFTKLKTKVRPPIFILIKIDLLLQCPLYKIYRKYLQWKWQKSRERLFARQRKPSKVSELVVHEFPFLIYFFNPFYIYRYILCITANLTKSGTWSNISSIVRKNVNKGGVLLKNNQCPFLHKRIRLKLY